ncbi:MAG: HAD family phosphatase [Clostridia bacterium]|nr:HAD family phosphatase [Clostridia bacterium]
MKYKLIITDYDDTMAKKGVVPEPTLLAIKEYINAGGKFAICTGRTPSSIKEKTSSYDLPLLVGAHQGSLIIDLGSGEIIRNGGLDYLWACEIIKEVRKEAPVVAYVGDDLIYEVPCRYSEVFNGICPEFQVDDLVEELKKRKQPVNRVIVSTVQERVPELMAKFQKKFGDKAIVNSGACYIVEIVSPNYTKKQAVEFFADYYGVPLSEVMTVGDSTNDIPLLSGEWHGVAVGSAFEELKAVADEITVPLSEHPLKYLIEKYCLEK